MQSFNKGDEVVVTNERSVNYGLTGKVVEIHYWMANGATHRIAIDGRKEQNYSPNSLRLKRTNKEIHASTKTTLPKPEHVMVYVRRDGEFDYDIDFGDEWWDEVVVTNDLQVIKEAVEDELNAWDFVYGILNGEPFLAKRDVMYEGVDISKL